MTEPRAPTAIDRHIGNKVRERRLETDMSQEHLAELLGITFQQVQKYERGVNRIAASRLYDAANALDVSIGYFFEDITRKQAMPRRPKKVREPSGPVGRQRRLPQT